MSRQNPRADRGVTLTRKGLVAAIVAAAEPYDWRCPCGDGQCRRNREAS